MKYSIILLLFLFLIGCTGNHLHDGRYKASVFTSTWVQVVEMEFNGNEMYYRTLSLRDDSIESEVKTSCKQYADRIECKGKDGLEYVMRVNEDGNLVSDGYTYKRQ